MNYDGIKMYPKQAHNTPILDKVRLVLRSSIGHLEGYTKKPYNQRFRGTQKSQKVQR